MIRLIPLVALVFVAACSSPAQRHMRRALCAGKGAVTNADFAKCYSELNKVDQ